MLYYNKALIFDYNRPIGTWALCQVKSESWGVRFLTEQEKENHANLKSPKRRKEWLSSRVALKQILMDLGRIESPCECLVKKDQFGCPHINLVKKSPSATVNCSISHKNGFASVCLSWGAEIKLGIDMECVSEKPFKLRRAFSHADDLLTSIKDAKEYYTVLWACKEAASKVIGMGLLKDLKDLIVEADDDGRFAVFEKGRTVSRGTYDFVQGFVVAVCHKRLALSENHPALEDGLETISI